MPMPISVNMVGVRLTSEAEARANSGLPAHRTAGVASASSIQGVAGPASAWRSDGLISAMAMPNPGEHTAHALPTARSADVAALCLRDALPILKVPATCGGCALVSGGPVHLPTEPGPTSVAATF